VGRHVAAAVVGELLVEPRPDAVVDAGTAGNGEPRTRIVDVELEAGRAWSLPAAPHLTGGEVEIARGERAEVVARRRRLADATVALELPGRVVDDGVDDVRLAGVIGGVVVVELVGRVYEQDPQRPGYSFTGHRAAARDLLDIDELASAWIENFTHVDHDYVLARIAEADELITAHNVRTGKNVG
jgi:hypothetical protein